MAHSMVTVDLVTLSVSASLTSELSAGELDGALFFGGNACSDKFAHLALEWGKTADLSNNFTDALHAIVRFTFAVGFTVFECVGASLRLSNDETLVQSDENASSLIHYLISENNKHSQIHLANTTPTLNSIYSVAYKTHGVLGFWGFGVLVIWVVGGSYTWFWPG